ncbi:hypothetical protein RHSIM_Rhsim01G0014000 [Rhododendron simsii]|uniref:F-box domain-containing protein n=1 Tax=Rhododendron simsii TaxID=118357 RepID=A0A834LU61_RHOSS|nr:hypothetical protein RHSIM_Rhsim01G0014000 [Rhododendron simsii]
MIGSTSSKRTKPITGAPSLEILPAVEVIANNVDLLTEILLRLPAKSLIRFKSVSKHWFSLISNSQFSITHTRRNPNPSISYFSCMPHEQPIPSRIAHTCNGLLLIEYARSNHYMVCNPTTQKYALIPDLTVYPYGCNPLRIISAYLDFDPSKSRHYKVVLRGHSYGYPGYNVGIDVYCSGSTSWKQIRAPGSELINAAFSGGAFYWFSDENMLVGFDVDSEKMIKIPNAPMIQGAGMSRCLEGCGGRLILILAYHLKILEMDKNDGSWMIGCEINLHIMSANLQTTPYWGNGFSVLSLVKKEEGKGYVLVLAFPGSVSPGKVIPFNLWYNTQFKQWTSVLYEVVPGESILDIPRYATAHARIESLSPI